ncbi:g6f-like [Mugil cephalus]|uniref:g6f-like n=1 Tax=Mugil cephalus TaxID=48193 RepID=UPI001FB73A0A|nr:g6f-like [Mugil cephalus]
MASGFLIFILATSVVVCSSHVSNTDWQDAVVAREGTPTTLVCTDTGVGRSVAINWMVKLPGEREWRLVLSADENKKFSGGASKASMQLSDPNFQDTGVFSLSFVPTVEDSGHYLCLIKHQEMTLKEKIIPLAILQVGITPAAPVPQHSTLRLIARVTPDSAVTKITWAAPGDISMKSERNNGTVTKLPQVQTSDHGVYVCTVHTWGSGSSSGSSSGVAFAVNVTVDANKVASFPNVTYAPEISTATQALAPFSLTCTHARGDYIMLHWSSPNSKQKNWKLVFQYDRWRGSSLLTERSRRLKLAGPPYNAETGSFSFLFTPMWEDGGLYRCEVFLNDNISIQQTWLTVLKVKTRRYPSKLELDCLYTEPSQVQSAHWKHNNTSRKLHMESKGPGIISTILPLPLTPNITGNYTCSLRLKNGQVVSAAQTVRLPSKELPIVIIPSLPASLSALLLLVPLVAAAVGVLLWRRKHISDRGIEQSLSVHSGETENIYENPDNIRQAPPQGSVYMDLKPRGEDDVYKELEQ